MSKENYQKHVKILQTLINAIIQSQPGLRLPPAQYTVLEDFISKYTQESNVTIESLTLEQLDCRTSTMDALVRKGLVNEAFFKKDGYSVYSLNKITLAKFCIEHKIEVPEIPNLLALAESGKKRPTIPKTSDEVFVKNIEALVHAILTPSVSLSLPERKRLTPYQYDALADIVSRYRFYKDSPMHFSKKELDSPLQTLRSLVKKGVLDEIHTYGRSPGDVETFYALTEKTLIRYCRRVGIPVPKLSDPHPVEKHKDCEIGKAPEVLTDLDKYRRNISRYVMAIITSNTIYSLVASQCNALLALKDKVVSADLGNRYYNAKELGYSEWIYDELQRMCIVDRILYEHHEPPRSVAVYTLRLDTLKVFCEENGVEVPDEIVAVAEAAEAAEAENPVHSNEIEEPSTLSYRMVESRAVGCVAKFEGHLKKLNINERKGITGRMDTGETILFNRKDSLTIIAEALKLFGKNYAKGDYHDSNNEALHTELFILIEAVVKKSSVIYQGVTSEI